MSTNVIFDHPTETISVARFARPDLREVLDDHGHAHDDIGNSDLYQELHAGAIAGLKDGGVLILNFGLVDVFVSAFFRLLIRVNENVKAKGGRMLLCSFTSRGQEAFALMGGPRTFEVFTTEPGAIAAAKK